MVTAASKSIQQISCQWKKIHKTLPLIYYSIKLHFELISNFYIYRPQRSWGKVIFSKACVKNSVHGGVVSQHALQVVFQHALQQVYWGGWQWYPNMRCIFSRPTPRGEVEGDLAGGGGSPGSHPRGKLRGIWPGGLQVHTQGGSWGGSGQGGSPGPHPRGKLRGI